MDLLLDTHSFLWFVAGDPSLSSNAQQAITNPQNRPYVSVGSLWEIIIKIGLGKLQLSMTAEDLFGRISLEGFELLPITPVHILSISDLPLYHKDPFDRLLIAQAKAENMVLVSKDANMSMYTLSVLW